MDRARGELRALTGLRGLAAWSVVVFHLRTSLSLGPTPLAVAGRLNVAVDLFFALSGFVIWHSWRERLAAGSPAVAADFLWRRLARIWPLHAGMLTLLVMFALALQVSGRAHPNQPWGLLPVHLALVQSWGLTDRLAWNDPDWSISAEWAVYLITPLLAAALDWRRVRGVALMAGLLAIPFALSAAMHALGAEAIGDLIPRTGLLRCLFDYLGGTMLSELWRRWQGHRRAPIVAAAGLAVAGVLAPWLPPIAAADLIVLVALLAVALSCGRPWMLLDRAPAVALGRWSYATYLVHYPLWTVWKLALIRDAAHPGAAVLMAYAATLLLVSRLAHTWIEQPAMACLSARQRAGRPRVVAARMSEPA